MPTWLLFSLIPAFLFAIVNHTDKYLVSRLFKGRGVGALITFSSLIGLPVALFVLAFNPTVIQVPPKIVLLMILNGGLYVAWVLPYLYAMQKDEASIIVPLFQLSSVFTLVFGFIFLNEGIAPLQILGCLLILVGGVGLSIDLSKTGSYGFKLPVFLLMLLSNILIALNGVFFKILALEENFWKSMFWESVGIFLAAIPLLSIAVYRKQFLQVIKENSKRAITINVFNESINGAGIAMINYATLLAPIGLIYFVSEGFQPIFVFIIGVLLTLFLPKISQENLAKKFVVQKILAISIILVGTYFISF